MKETWKEQVQDDDGLSVQFGLYLKTLLRNLDSKQITNFFVSLSNGSSLDQVFTNVYQMSFREAAQAAKVIRDDTAAVYEPGDLLDVELAYSETSDEWFPGKLNPTTFEVTNADGIVATPIYIRRNGNEYRLYADVTEMED